MARYQQWTNWMDWSDACGVLDAAGAMNDVDPRAMSARLLASGRAEKRKLPNGYHAEWRFRKSWFEET